MCSRQLSDFGGKEMVNTRSSCLCHILRALSTVSSLKMASSLRVQPLQLPSPVEFLPAMYNVFFADAQPYEVGSQYDEPARGAGLPITPANPQFPFPPVLAIFTFYTAMGGRIDVLKAQLWPSSKVLS